jgi:MFS family permease
MNPTSSTALTLATLRSFPRPVWILFAGTFLNKFGTFVMPFLALHLTRQGYSLGEAGLAVGAYGLGQLIACAVGGHLADTMGRRKTIVLSMFSAAAAMLALSQARGLPAIVALTALAGLTAELYRPASSALLADLVPPAQRVTAFAAYRLAFNAGFAFGPAAAGFLSQDSFFWLFVGDALTSALFGVVAWFALPHGLRGTEAQARWSEAARVIARDRRFHQVLAASMAVGLVFLQLGSTYGLHVTRLGFSDAVYGLLLSMNGVLVVLFELPITGLTQRLPPRRVMAFGYLLIAAGFGSNAFGGGVAALALGMAVFTFGEMCAMPVASAYVSELAPEHLRGRYWGALGFVWSLALVCGPALGMALFGRSPALLWIVCGALGVLAAALIGVERRPARAAAPLTPDPAGVRPDT